MTTDEIASRFKAKPRGKGFVARCPAHVDRRPSLTIAEGRYGRTVLHCFKGCEVEAVMRAVGLSLGDLFEQTAATIRRVSHRVTASEVSLALAIEEGRYRERHAIAGLLRTSEINAIRMIVAKRYRIELAPIARPLSEGGFGGRERDPAWSPLFAWALGVASVKLIGAPIAFDETLPPPCSVLIEAEELAAEAMRSLEREARQVRSEAAA